MKKYIGAAIFACLLSSCSSDDTTVINSNEKGNLQLYFDPTLHGDQLIINTSTFPSKNDETIKISKFNYIISNIRLKDDQGNEFVDPKNDSYFIINTEANQQTIQLTNIPQGNYTLITFGLGVDPQKYLTGEENQQEFWDYAATQDMTWSWITGYKFINFEGEFTSATVSNPTTFSLHIGSHGTALDNYKEVTLSLPNTARVRTHTTPSIHFLVDAMQLLDGTNEVKLENHLNPAGTSASIMVNAEWSPKIMSNATQMFSVDHVHNGGEGH